jgi:hypothetical protein
MDGRLPIDDWNEVVYNPATISTEPANTTLKEFKKGEHTGVEFDEEEEEEEEEEEKEKEAGEQPKNTTSSTVVEQVRHFYVF